MQQCILEHIQSLCYTLFMSDTERLLDIIQMPHSGEVQALELMGEDFISAPFYFSLSAIIEGKTLPIQALLGQPISFRIGNENSEHKIYNGLIYNATKNITNTFGQSTLRLLIQPWFRFLADKIDSRVYAVKKPMNVPDIVKSVFDNNGYNDYKFNLTKTYKPLNICVQYNESDFNFVSRLLEQVGIYYYFAHRDDRHIMVLSDAPFPKMAKPINATHVSDGHNGPHISQWCSVATPMSALITTQRYDFTAPSELLVSKQSSANKKTGLPPEFLANLNRFNDNPANATVAEMNAASLQTLQGFQCNSLYAQATSSYPSWQAGTVFSLQNHDIQSQIGEYYIYAVAHHVQDHSQLPSTTHDAPAQHYYNTFRAYKTSQSFVPQARYIPDGLSERDTLMATPPKATQFSITKPSISGLHNAVVVGPKDTPIYTDKYGRVKLQFDWDLHSHSDENSFAWVRMKQAWGSDQFGAHFTPRVGQEVLVSFEHGDPNQPTIIGVMPSDSSKPPFTPGKTPTQTGFQSKSLSPDSAQISPSGHHLMFDDDPKNAAINLHAYKDLHISTNNDHSVMVQGKTTTTLKKGNYQQQVGGKLTITAKKAVHIINGNSRISITPTDITIEANKISMGAAATPANMAPGLASTAANTLAQQPSSPTKNKKATESKTAHYWLALQYPHLKNNVNPPAQSFTISTQTSNSQKATDLKRFSGNLNANSIGSTEVDKSLAISHVQLTQSDVISINNKAIAYPQLAVQTQSSDWTAATASDLPGATLNPGDKQLQADVLFPVILKNLREDAPSDAQQTLSQDEINYFKQAGNNATVFIHGFNVPFGEFPNAISNIEKEPDLLSNEALGINKLDVTYATSERTYYCGLEKLKNIYPKVGNLLDPFNLDLPPNLQDMPKCPNDGLNGTGAQNWFIRMEDNLNRATNQFKRDDYTNYTRCIHIAWSGDVFVANYLDAEPSADKAGEKLLPLLTQLHAAGIKINIIAHSLGNRVLLRAMSLLGSQGKSDILDHVFLWEAAVPATALSSNQRQQLLNQQSDQFLNAADASKKITVLYSKNDIVLEGAYWFAKYSGLTMHNMPQRYIDTAKKNWRIDFSDAQTQKAHQTLVDMHRCLGWLNQTNPSATSKAEYQQTCDDLHAKLAEYGKTPTVLALGRDGLDSQRGDEQIKMLIKENKLMLANMTPYSTGHSYMHVPDEKVMVHGYQTHIINKNYQGVDGFGTYSKADFPDYATDETTTSGQGGEE